MQISRISVDFIFIRFGNPDEFLRFTVPDDVDLVAFYFSFLNGFGAPIAGND